MDSPSQGESESLFFIENGALFRLFICLYPHRLTPYLGLEISCPIREYFNRIEYFLNRAPENPPGLPINSPRSTDILIGRL